MRIRRREKNRSPRASITRYYRPKESKRFSSQPNKKADKDKKTSRISKFVQSLPFILIVYLLIVNTMLNGVSVKINDQSDRVGFRSISEYTDGVDSIIASSLYNQNKLTLNSDKLESDIIRLFPEVTSANAVVPLAGRVLSVGLSLDEPALRYKNNSSNQGVIGASGRLIILNSASIIMSNYSDLPTLELSPSVDIQLGGLVFTSVENELIELLRQEFNGDKSYSPSLSSIVFMVDKREMHAYFKGKDYFAKLTPEREAASQVGSLLATMKQLVEQGNEPDEYLDVRVEERVFVK